MVRGMYHRSLAGATESCLISKRALLKAPHGLVLFVSSVAAAAQMLKTTMIGCLYLAIAALGLTGCASPWPYSEVSRGGYEPAVLSGEPAPRGTQTRAAEARKGRTDVQQARRGAFTTDVSTYPPIPVFNSPEEEREHQQTERLDKELERTLKSICRGC